MGGSQDLSGAPRNDAPDWSGNLAIHAEFPLDEYHKLTVDPVVYFKSDHYLSAEFDPILFQESFAKLDLRIALASEAGWQVALFGRNLTDEVTGSFASAVTGAAMAAPATWSIARGRSPSSSPTSIEARTSRRGQALKRRSDAGLAPADLMQLEPGPDDPVDAADQQQRRALEPAVNGHQVHPVERGVDEAAPAALRSPCSRPPDCPSGCRRSKSGSATPASRGRW